MHCMNIFGSKSSQLRNRISLKIFLHFLQNKLQQYLMIFQSGESAKCATNLGKYHQIWHKIGENDEENLAIFTII